MSAQQATRGLHCLRGQAPPPDLADDLRRLLALPDAAQRKLWEALGPALAEPLPDDVEARLTQFCKDHRLADEALARPLKASRFLLRAAAEIDLDRARFTEDLLALAGNDAPRLVEILTAGFDVAKRFVRRGLVARTLEGHGKVVERTEWRVERILASNHGDGLDAAVALVTFDVRDGGRREKITLQLDAEALAELARAHAKLSGKA